MKAPAIAVLASDRGERCPPSCLCETRTWFSPSSVCAEAFTVDCNDLGLSVLPAWFPSQTRVVLLQSNNIAKMETATEIDLSHNISSVADVCLGWLPELLSLHLEENLVQQLTDSCLASLPILQEFYINHNLISFISPGAFRGLSKLTRLYLNCNQLRIINCRWFQHLSTLEVLMLAENPILQLTHVNFKPLVDLRSLVLAKISLTGVPKNALVGLNRLESICFFDNLLSQVPRALLSSAQNLRFLDLNKTSFKGSRKETSGT